MQKHLPGVCSNPFFNIKNKLILFSEKVEEKLEDKPNLSPMLTKQPTTEEGTIITYTGLSETTQERIRR